MVARSKKPSPPPAASSATRQTVASRHEAAERLKQLARATRKQMREQKAKFDAADAKGRKALVEHDYQALDDAIRVEKQVIEGLPLGRKKR